MGKYNLRVAFLLLLGSALGISSSNGGGGQFGGRKIHSYVSSENYQFGQKLVQSSPTGPRQFIPGLDESMETIECNLGAYVTRIKDNLPHSLYVTCSAIDGQNSTDGNIFFTNITEPASGTWFDCNEPGTDAIVTDVKGFSALKTMWFSVFSKDNFTYYSIGNFSCSGWDRWVSFGHVGFSDRIGFNSCPAMTAVCGVIVFKRSSIESNFVGQENVSYTTGFQFACCGFPEEYYWSGTLLHFSGVYNEDFVQNLSPKKWLANEGLVVPSSQIVNPTPGVLNLLCNPGEYIHKLYIAIIPDAFSIAFFFDWWHGGGIFGPSYSFGYFQYPLIVNDFYCRMNGTNESRRLSPDFYSHFNIDIYNNGGKSGGKFLDCGDEAFAFGIGSDRRFLTKSNNDRYLRGDYTWYCENADLTTFNSVEFVETQTHLELWEELRLKEFPRSPFSCPNLHLLCGVQATIRNATKDFILSNNAANVFKGLTYDYTSYDRMEAFTTQMPIEGYFFKFMCCPLPNPNLIPQ